MHKSIRNRILLKVDWRELCCSLTSIEYAFYLLSMKDLPIMMNCSIEKKRQTKKIKVFLFFFSEIVCVMHNNQGDLGIERSS